MYRINPKNYQWVLDIAFGIALILPLILFFVDIAGEMAVYITFGVGIGYIIHVTQKMLVFNDILEEAVEEKAETKTSEKVEEKTQTEAEKAVNEKIGIEDDEDLEDKIEEKAEKKADKVVEDKMGVKTEEDLEDKIEEKAEEMNK